MKNLMQAINPDPDSMRAAVDVGVHKMVRCPRHEDCWCAPDYLSEHLKEEEVNG